MAPSFLRVMSLGMIVSIMGCSFGGKGFCRLEFWPINVDFKTSKGLLVHLQEFPFRDLVCAFLSDWFSTPTDIFPKKEKGMSSSDSVSLSTSSSESIESGRSRGRLVEEESTSSGGVVGGIPMETVREVREDPLEELAESNWPAKGGYGWVAADVRNQSFLFRWSRLLNSWLNCTPVIAKCVSGGIVSLERVSAIDRVCHGQEGATEKFFYMYMCHFSQLHVRLSLDDFTMDVLRALNVAPTQLHPNSWADMQAFRILYQSLYLEPSPYAFLYFYDTRPRQPSTWLSLISRPSIRRLDAFS